MNLVNNSKSIDKFFSKPKPKSDSGSDTNIVNPPIQSNQSYFDIIDKNQNNNPNIDQDNDQDNHTQSIIYDKEPYILANKKYFFLNDNLLSQKFGDFMDTQKQYTIHFCIFKINMDGELPFLQYLFNNTSDKMGFSKIDFQCVVNSETNQEVNNNTDSSDTNHTFFMNACSQELLRIIPIHDIFNSQVLQKIYKGFIEDENKLYMFFDASVVNTLIDPAKYSWAIIDEIVHTRKIRNKEIEPEIIQLFIKSPYIMYILDEMGQRVLQPNILYLCDKVGSVYNTEEENTNTDSINILEDQVEHDLFGLHYIFSSGAIGDADLVKIKKYAVFTYNSKYILKDITTISQEDKDKIFSDLEDDSTIQSIYFKEDGIQFWAIQTSNQIFLLQ